MNLKILALSLLLIINSASAVDNINKSPNENETLVAVIDSYVNAEHDYLKDRCVEGESFLIDQSNHEDHGTSIAGAVLKYSDITASKFNHSKGNITILPIEINVLDIQEDYGLLMGEAIQYAVDSGADVINMSFSSASPNSYVYEKIREGIEEGVIFVSAAGNSGYDSYNYPAAYEGVVSVGSISLNEEGKWVRSSFSNKNDDVDLVICGEKIMLPSGSLGYSEKTGTSFSSAAVSGILGELINRYPDIDNDYILNSILDTATYIDEKGCGYGNPDIDKAIDYLKSFQLTGISPLSYSSSENKILDVIPLIATPVSAGRSHMSYVEQNKIIIEGNKSSNKGAALNWNNIEYVYAGSNNIAAIDSSGIPKAAGYNIFNKNILRSWHDIKSLTLSSNFTAGLTNTKKVIVTEYFKNTDTSSWENIVQISSGGHHLAALCEDGKVLTIGYNIYGQMDTKEWKSIVYTASNTKNTAGIDKNGKVYVSGDNFYGQLNVDDWCDIVSVDIGDGFIVGLKSNGTVVARGRNIYNVCNVEDLKNIVYIDASDTYFIAIDSNNNRIIKGKMRE